jgi:phosphoribosylformimino-5-aminoimidazole carboxamide ribotide isomerase
MLVVPVIDLMGGAVVHARRGERGAYAPIVTPLAASAEPGAVVEGLLAVAPFANLYIADVDALEGRSGHEAVVAVLVRRFPEVRFWVDKGVREAAAVDAAIAQGVDVVIGSETQTGVDLVMRYRDDPRVALSLDFRGDAFVGPAALLEEPQFWPQRVIAMTLARVGSGHGPDVERLHGIKVRAGERRVFAAGGVRGPDDLRALAAAGIAGALVATAIHEGAIGMAMLPPGGGSP